MDPALSGIFTTIDEDQPLSQTEEQEKSVAPAPTDLDMPSLGEATPAFGPAFINYRAKDAFSFSESRVNSYSSEVEDGFGPTDDFRTQQITKKPLSPKTPKGKKWDMILGSTSESKLTTTLDSSGNLKTMVKAIGAIGRLYARATTKIEKKRKIKQEALEILHRKARGTRDHEELHKLRTLFKTVELFQEDCDWRDMLKICQDAKLLSVPQNSPIFVQGQVGQFYYVNLGGDITGYSTSSVKKTENLMREFKKDGSNNFKPTTLPTKAFGNEVISIDDDRGFGDLKPGDSLYAWTAVTKSTCSILQIRMDLYVACMKNNGQMNLYNLVEFLKKTRLMHQIPDGYLSSIAYRMKSEKFSRGENIVTAGDEIKDILIIHSGQASIKESESVGYLNHSYNFTYQTVNRDVSTCLSGSTIGAFEIAEERTTFDNTVVSASPSVSVLRMHVNQFRKIMRDHPEVIENFITEERARVKWRQKKLNQEYEKLDQYILRTSSGEDQRKFPTEISKLTKGTKNPRSLSPRNEIESDTRSFHSLMASNLRNLRSSAGHPIDIVSEIEEVTDVTEQMKTSIRSMKSTRSRLVLGAPKRDKGSPDFSSRRPLSASVRPQSSVTSPGLVGCSSRPDYNRSMSAEPLPSAAASRPSRPSSPSSAPYSNIASPHVTTRYSQSRSPSPDLSSSLAYRKGSKGRESSRPSTSGSSFQLLSPSSDQLVFPVPACQGSAFSMFTEADSVSPIQQGGRWKNEAIEDTQSMGKPQPWAHRKSVQIPLPDINSPEDSMRKAPSKEPTNYRRSVKFIKEPDPQFLRLQLPRNSSTSNINSPGSPEGRLKDIAPPDKLPGYKQNTVKETLQAQKVLYENLENFAMKWVAENHLDRFREDPKKTLENEPLVNRLQRLSHVIEMPDCFHHNTQMSYDLGGKRLKLPSRGGVVYDIDHC